MNDDIAQQVNQLSTSERDMLKRIDLQAAILVALTAQDLNPSMTDITSHTFYPQWNDIGVRTAGQLKVISSLMHQEKSLTEDYGTAFEYRFNYMKELLQKG